MKNKVDFLNGNIFSSLLIFSVPLLVANLFLQLYSAVDAWAVGNYVSSISLAAVGAASPVVNTVIGFVIGVSAGVGVIISRCSGAHDKDRLEKAVHVTLSLTLILGIILESAGLLLSKQLLVLLKTPEEILGEGVVYLKLFFLGAGILVAYNMGSGVLRAVGDATNPLYSLVFSSIIHILLDVLLVQYMGLGVAGTGISMLISLTCGLAWIIVALCSYAAANQLRIWKMSLDRRLFGQSLALGMPTGIQQCIGNLSNVMVQTYINVFGATVIAGYGVGVRIDSFVILPLLTLNMAVTTFVAQNVGAGRYDRVRQGTKIALISGVVMMLAAGGILLGFRGIMITAFNGDYDVVMAGDRLLEIFLPFYVVLPFVQVLGGTLRGNGFSLQPMFIVVGNFLVLRLMLMEVAQRLFATTDALYVCWPITWITCAVMTTVCYHVKVGRLYHGKMGEIYADTGKNASNKTVEHSRGYHGVHSVASR